MLSSDTVSFLDIPYQNKTKNNLKKPLWELYSFHGKESIVWLLFFLYLTEKNVPIYFHFISQHYFSFSISILTQNMF